MGFMILTCTGCGAQNRVPSARLHEPARCGSCKSPLAVEAPIEVRTEAEFAELTRDCPLPVLVDFWAPWCGPCRTVAPELVQLARAHAGRLIVAKVNTDELGGVAARLDITSIPTLGLYRGGELVQREVGARNRRGIEQVFHLS
jgi:thioredoxin 2